jgi:D-alanine-D-alanine ligase
MKKKTIALISGGISSERECPSTAANRFMMPWTKNKYDILRYDPKTDIPRLVSDAGKIGCALIILHGPYGEDGTVQGLLDLLDIPYQGAGVLGSAVAMNKLLSKHLYERAGLAVPPYAWFGEGNRWR